jgi:hypothetical protein
MGKFWRALAAITAAAVAVSGTAGAAAAAEPHPDDPIVVATPLVGEPAAGARLTLERSLSSVYPHADGYRDTVKFTASVDGQTGAPIAATGTVTVASGATVVQSWSLATSDSQTFTWDGLTAGALVPGHYTVTANVTTADGQSLTDSVRVYSGATRMKSIGLTRDGGIAPAKDGYRDTVTFTVASATSIRQSMPVTGRVKVLRNGVTVATWPLSDSGTQKIVWNGRIGGRIVPGDYLVKAIARGPEGRSVTRSIPVKVFDTSLVAVTGVVSDGRTVTSTLSDPGWGGAPVRHSTQWMLDGESIVGEKGTQLKLTEAMVGHELSVRVATRVNGVRHVGTSERTMVHPGATSAAKLTSSLQTLIQALPGDYSVKIRELDAGWRNVSIGARAALEPASSIKVFIAYAVYKGIDEGTLSYSSLVASGITVEQCLRAMIEVSDNDCAVELRNLVGTSRLNQIIDDGGYDDTHFWYSGGRTKFTSATDLADLIARLGYGNLLSKDSSERFMHLLKTQVWRIGIPKGLPYDVVQGSKPGSIWAPGGMVQTDVAFVRGKKTRYSIAVIGYNGADAASIAKISRLVYSHLQGSFATPFLYDWQQMVTTAPVVLRSKANSTGTAVDSFAAGTRVQAIDSTRDWYYVRIGGKVGWVPNTVLALRNPVL